MKRFLPTNYQGIVIDAVFILLNLFLLPFIGSKLEILFDESFQNDERAFKIITFIIIAVFFLRFIGLYLKRFSLQNRRSDSHNVGIVGWMWFFNFGTILLSGAFVIMFIIVTLKDSGVADLSNNDALIGLTGLIIPLIELFLLYNLTAPLNENQIKLSKKGNWRFSITTELFANFGLFAYIFVWQAFYNFYLSVIMPNVFRSITAFIGIFIISLFVFLFFYLAPRTVFLIEDAKYKSTWLSISLVFLSSLIPYLIFW